MPDGYKVSIELAAKVSGYVRDFGLAEKATTKLQDAQQGLARSSAETAAALTAAGAAAGAQATNLKAAARETAALERAEHKLLAGRSKAPRSTGASSGLSGVLPDPKLALRAGADSGKGFVEGLAGSVNKLAGTTLAAPLVAAGVVASPLIGATIAGAVVGAAGAGGVIGGLVLAARDPRVKQAGTTLGRDLLGDLEKRSKVFVAPALDGINDIRNGYAQLGPELDRIFGDSSKFVKPLVKGAVAGVTAITKGVADAVSKAEPVIDSLGAAEARIGEAIGQSFSKLATHADEGASAIDRVTSSTVALIGTTTTVVGALSTVYGWYDQIDKKAQSATGMGIWQTTLGALGPVASLLEKVTGGSDAAAEGVDGAAGAMKYLDKAAAGAAEPLTQLQVEQKVLNGTMLQGITAAKGLANALGIINGPTQDAAQAEIDLANAVDAVTAARKENGRSTKGGSKDARENRESLIQLARAVDNNVDAVYRKAGGDANAAAASKAATVAYDQGRAKLAEAAGQFTKSKQAAKEFAATLLNRPPNWTPEIKLKDNGAKKKVDDLKGAAEKIKPQYGFNFSANTGKAKAKTAALLKNCEEIAHPEWSFNFAANTGQAMGSVNALEHRLNSLNGRTVTTYVRTKATFVGPVAPGSAYSKEAKGGAYVPRQRGGYTAAAEGLLQPEIAPPGTRYQWAEPQTGGELFLPRKGINKARGRDLLKVAAEWYDGMFVPMAKGGFTAAARGLVNMAPTQSTITGTRLDSMSAYIGARDAVVSLNAALKENGRTLSINTVKGRANRSELISGVQAAKASAEAKFAETGSVKAANREYSEHISRLRRVLAQQKINGATISSLLKQLSTRPDYGSGPVPTNSLANIAFTKDKIGLNNATADAKNFFTWGKPSFNTNTTTGQDELNALFSFLEQASTAAQSRFAQTGSSKSATALYNQSLATLRGILGKAGMPKAAIDKLLKTYGRITLNSNADGGIHMAASGLVNMTKAQSFGAGQTLYGFREPSTGGEAFVPRYGDRQRSEQILQTAAGWYGGRYTRGSQGGSSGSGGMTVRVVVDDGAVRGLVRVEVDEQFGALADAQVYATAG